MTTTLDSDLKLVSNASNMHTLCSEKVTWKITIASVKSIECSSKLYHLQIYRKARWLREIKTSLIQGWLVILVCTGFSKRERGSTYIKAEVRRRYHWRCNASHTYTAKTFHNYTFVQNCTNKCGNRWVYTCLLGVGLKSRGVSEILNTAFLLYLFVDET